jgi:phosphohistidine phosphatase
MDDMADARRLIVMRHAKAVQPAGGPGDAARELRPRGRRDAASAGRWLAAQGLLPDQVLCSPAARARQTWQLVSEQLGPGPQVFDDPRLYDAGVADLLAIIGETQPEVSTLLYVGHNPAAAELAAELTGAEVELPTSALAVISVTGDWPGIAPGTGELLAHWRPHPDG